MSIEALFAVRFGHHDAPTVGVNGGVVVFESGRVFGGDTWFAYTGHYQIDGSTLTGEIRAQRHNSDPNSESAWGTDENDFNVDFKVQVDDAHQNMQGVMSRPGMGNIALRLIRVAELPG